MRISLRAVVSVLVIGLVASCSPDDDSGTPTDARVDRGDGGVDSDVVACSAGQVI